VVDAARALELAEGAVVAATVAGRACVFLAGLHRAEQGTAERLSGLLAGSPPWPAVDPDQAIPWAERKAGITLADSQREAVRLALRAKVLVITGGPGVGKTTLVHTILQILRAKTPAVALAAPTGRAAKRMTEARSAGGGRGLDGRRAAAARAAQGGTAPGGAAPRGRCRPVALGRAGAGAGRPPRERGRAGGAAERGVPPGGQEPDRGQRAPERADRRLRRAGRRL
jgi:hypothetical protein